MYFPTLKTHRSIYSKVFGIYLFTKNVFAILPIKIGIMLRAIYFNCHALPIPKSKKVNPSWHI